MISISGVLRSWKLRDYAAVLAALLTQSRIEWSMHRRPLPEFAAALGVPLVTDTSTVATEPFTVRLTRDERRALRAVRRVLRHWPWGNTCLRRAMGMGYVLRHRSPSLRVGVTKSDGAVKAHAWLEIDGRTLDPDAPTTYLSLVDVPREGAA